MTKPLPPVPERTFADDVKMMEDLRESVAKTPEEKHAINAYLAWSRHSAGTASTAAVKAV